AILLMLFLWRMPDRGARLPRVLERLRHAIEGIRRMANVRTLVFCAAASLISWGMQALPYWALSKSYHLGLSMGAMMAVLILMRTATIVPAAPGNAGLLQMACVLALSFFGIDKTHATGFSALIFLALTLPLLVGGAILVALTGVRFHDLRPNPAELAAIDSPGM
ncbi:MAG TPA: lysylphosphatidylglycerol synthase transmembrane domain-containing protein, partial [Terriglobia bacterium]|nr:lysylphosphatidylglycerol synthase transmembrane domain-containing protein [Terriglobia bacterium]